MTGPTDGGGSPPGWVPPPVWSPPPPPRMAPPPVHRPPPPPPRPYQPQYQAAPPPRPPYQPPSQPARTGSDWALFIGGGLCAAVGAAGAVLRATGLLPSGWATAVVLVAMAIGLRIFVGYAGRAASSARQSRIARLVALTGLAVSGVAVVTALPILLDDGDSNLFVEDVFAHLWTIALLLALAGTARTLNWMTLVGMGLTGFLALTGLAYALGRPVVTALGDSSALATSLYVPITEELLKALPALLILVIALRHGRTRPSALEMTVLGALVGAGFAIYEDTQYGRGGFDVTAMPIASLLNPTAVDDKPLMNITYFSAGHMVYTAVITLGLAIGLLYRRVYRWAPLAIPVTFAVGAAEHCTHNYASIVAFGDGSTALLNILRALTLWGWTSTLLLLGGLVVVARTELGATRGGRALGARLSSAFWLSPASARFAAGALAHAQRGPRPAQEAAR